MKKLLLFTQLFGLLFSTGFAQSYLPINLTGYNADIIAENSPAMSYTSTSIDGSDYVLYSVDYGNIYSTGSGLPNSGVIANGLYNYQLAPYSQNNAIFLTGGTTDSFSITSPRQYAALSLLGLSTEGSGTLTITLRFTDGSTQQYTGQALPDWFYNSNPVISGFDRAGRITNSPDYLSGEPRMYAVNLSISCANQQKNLSKIIINNTSASARACIFAVSGINPVSDLIAHTDITCFGSGNGTVTSLNTGGINPVSYLWSNSQTTSSLSSLSAGIYSVTITDGNGCSAVATDTINEPAPLLVLASASLYGLCSGTADTLNATGGTTYQWSNADTGATIVVYPTSATNGSLSYTVTATDANNCSASQTVNVSINPLPTLATAFIPSDTVCMGSNVTLTATGADTYVWNNGVIDGVSFIATATQDYIVAGTDSNGCVNTDTVTLTVNSLPAISTTALPNDTLCAGLNVTLSGAGAVSYVWSDNVTNGVGFAVSNTATYSVTGTDINGCSNTDSVTITVNQLPNVGATVSDDTICNGSSVTFTGTGADTYTWSSGIVDGVAYTPASSSVYAVTGTDANGCNNVASVEVTVQTCVGINNLQNATDIQLYPNPNAGIFSMLFNQNISNANISITDVTGKSIFQKQTNITSGYKMDINIVDAAKGLYFVSVFTKSALIKTYKVNIQ